MTEFKPTHEFTVREYHLGELVVERTILVAAEHRGDWLAFEADGTPWYTVCGDLQPYWTCRDRGIDRVDRVVKYGHRFAVTDSSSGRSYRYECECGEIGCWMRSEGAASKAGADHHQDAVRV